MEIIQKKRGHGKTTDLIYLSAKTGNTIVHANPLYVKERAKELHLEIPEPMSIMDLKQLKPQSGGIYIDELSFVLEKLFGCKIAGFTETVEDNSTKPE